MVVEPDGSVVIRSQAIDKSDEVREDMFDNYNLALKDSQKPRAPGVAPHSAVIFGRGGAR